jgi:hypothetical protein
LRKSRSKAASLDQKLLLIAYLPVGIDFKSTEAVAELRFKKTG